MRVGIVGAGAAGLAAARTLKAAGHEVVVFEKSRGFGGRAATKRIGEYTFDSGATSIAPRGLALQKVMLEELPQDELVQVTRPIYTHSMGRIEPGDSSRNRMARYTYRSGINRLGKLLAEGIDVRLESKVERIEAPKDGGCAMMGEVFDAAILTAPMPQTAELLKTLGEDRGLSFVGYRRTLSVMFGFDRPFNAPWHAVIDPEQAEPLTWLSVESLKCDGRAPEGHTAIVCQMNARYSLQRYEADDQTILDETLVDVVRLLGPEFQTPVVSGIHRWKFAQPEATIQMAAANRAGSKVLVAGDGIEGARVELAYESGVRAAERLLFV